MTNRINKDEAIEMDVGTYVVITRNKVKQVSSGFITHFDEDGFAVHSSGARIDPSMSDGHIDHEVTIIPLQEVVGRSSMLATIEMVQARSYALRIEDKIRRLGNDELAKMLPELKALAEEIETRMGF